MKTKEEKKEQKEKELTKLLEEENAELKNKVLYKQAEFQNYQKRTQEEFSKALKYEAESTVVKLLPTLDDFERALKMDDQNKTDEVSKFLVGFEMIYKNLNDLLTNLEVKEIDALNKKFDPELHQAVLTDFDPNQEDDTILAILQKGYMLKDKVIRPAMVKVNKKEEKGEDK